MEAITVSIFAMQIIQEFTFCKVGLTLCNVVRKKDLNK